MWQRVLPVFRPNWPDTGSMRIPWHSKDKWCFVSGSRSAWWWQQTETKARHNERSKNIKKILKKICAMTFFGFGSLKNLGTRVQRCAWRVKSSSALLPTWPEEFTHSMRWWKKDEISFHLSLISRCARRIQYDFGNFLRPTCPNEGQITRGHYAGDQCPAGQAGWEVELKIQNQFRQWQS